MPSIRDSFAASAGWETSLPAIERLRASDLATDWNLSNLAMSSIEACSEGRGGGRRQRATSVSEPMHALHAVGPCSYDCSGLYFPCELSVTIFDVVPRRTSEVLLPLPSV
eukprot:scaffold49781_cov63-Phaeocystis_antarctica.AAC.4